MTATAVEAPVEVPRHILVNGARIRLRLVQQVIWSVLAANAGALIIAAVYYLLTQVRWHVGSTEILYLKPSWDGLFSFRGWAADRHDVRDVYESALATLFVKSLLANWRKHPDRRVGPLRLLTAPLVIVVAAAPVVVTGIWALNYGLPWLWHKTLGHEVVHNPVHFTHSLDWLGTFLAGWNWQLVLIGVFTGLVVHRIYAPVGNTIQLFGVERQVDKARDALTAGKDPDRYRPRWPLPPVIRERFAWMMATSQAARDYTTTEARIMRWLVPFMGFVFFALAVVGGYAKYWLGTGH